ncbi:hypothetical protein MKQ68_03880 [Chitinophaga horti]|uniref:Uncharacterized protein n=1 Tax=Chitinophaga horti TaxID=2920382 RepID=A0ABY6J3I3_9BACT|nr:hypothetical protein [Chitinophaga horti]UYQ94230.1 hypothetical protein MKQ68_03880 [Chitinophaga horti]
MSISNSQLLYAVLIIGAAVIIYSTIKDLIKKEKEKSLAGSQPPATPSSNAALPLQLQAYERIVLYVERITPQSLITRVSQPGLTVSDMQVGLIQTIKAEFEHNISQQIYVSAEAWEAVKTVKEQLISIIIQVASKLPADASGKELNKGILEVFLQSGESPADIAARIISAEAKKIM